MNTTYMTKAQAGLPVAPKEAAIEAELVKIQAKYKKEVTPDLVLQEAKNPKHPLHKYFEWDDTIAAQKYRLAQAYQMILANKIVVEIKESRGSPPKVVTSQHVVRGLIPSFTGEGFKPRDVVLSKKDQRAAFLEQKKEQLRAWCRSVVDLKEFKKLREHILKEIGE